MFRIWYLLYDMAATNGNIHVEHLRTMTDSNLGLLENLTDVAQSANSEEAEILIQ